ncbi:hypothetical protein Hdeb2414_s0150g00814641 [Helianthus debilis subsp. tardiflorus]
MKLQISNVNGHARNFLKSEDQTKYMDCFKESRFMSCYLIMSSMMKLSCR